MYWFKPATIEGLTQASGDTILELGSMADYYHIIIVPSAGATGTLRFDGRFQGATFVPIEDNGTPVEVDLSSTTLNFVIDGWRLSQLKVKPTLVVGSVSIIVNQASQ